jgi:hypothetical protein
LRPAPPSDLADRRLRSIVHNRSSVETLQPTPPFDHKSVVGPIDSSVRSV